MSIHFISQIQDPIRIAIAALEAVRLNSPLISNILLNEDGSFFLCEDGSYLLFE